MARAEIADPAGGVGERLTRLRRPARDALVAVGVLRALYYFFVQGIRPWEFAGVDARAYWGIDIAHLGTVTGVWAFWLDLWPRSTLSAFVGGRHGSQSGSWGYRLRGVLATLHLAPTRWGWAAAVALSVLATPRLVSYMLMTLLAALRRDRR